MNITDIRRLDMLILLLFDDAKKQYQVVMVELDKTPNIYIYIYIYNIKTITIFVKNITINHFIKQLLCIMIQSQTSRKRL
jgi:hypothetical protein